MRKLFTHPLFLAGLALRLAMLAFVLPDAAAKWYVPFLDTTTANFTVDPWGAFLNSGGTPVAFPYGYVMWLVFLPFTVLMKLVGGPLHYAYGLTLLIADFFLLLILQKLLGTRSRLLLVIYWMSPIVLLATYWLGLNDLVPVVLLSGALYFIRQLRPAVAGALCGAAVSAKFSMIVAVPFFVIYLFRNPSLRALLSAYLKGLVVAAVAFLLPFVFSASGLQMLLNNPEMSKVYQFTLKVGNDTVVYVLPMAYLLMLYVAWRVRRLNFDLFNALLGMAFFLVVLLTPASPGWFIWILPLLIFYQARSGRVAVVLTGVFSILYAILIMPWPTLSLFDGEATVITQTVSQLGMAPRSMLHTAMTAIGVILAIRIWREAVTSTNYFRLSRKPFVIGIAGDSGAGKDTLADSLVGLFGRHSVASLSGDDYHLWDRQKPMWQVMTHLNPMANDLERFADDLVALTDGKSIMARHYDHETGKMSRSFRVKSNDFIIASGLHALYLPILRECYNLTVYLDIDEGLRRHLKLVRDMHRRGHSVDHVLSSLEKREPDSARFIRPQAAHADLVMSLQPIHPSIVEDLSGKQPLRFKLFVRSQNGLNELSLTRVLVGVCGLHVEMNITNDATETGLTIEGETTADDVALAAKILFPRMLEFLDINPQWQDGVLGLMQLITLSHINQALNKRLI
jgi:uridine kinase